LEICRHKNNIDVFDELAEGNFDALKRVPALAASVAEKQWSAAFTPCLVCHCRRNRSTRACGDVAGADPAGQCWRVLESAEPAMLKIN
jgi:hypothetical protein